MRFPQIQQFVKVILSKTFALLQTLIVEHKIFKDELLQRLRGPYPELRRPPAVYAVTDGNDGVEVIEINLPVYLTSTFRLNYPEFPDSCFLLQFSGFVNVLKMLTNSTDIYPKQLPHLFLT